MVHLSLEEIMKISSQEVSWESTRTTPWDEVYPKPHIPPASEVPWKLDTYSAQYIWVSKENSWNKASGGQCRTVSGVEMLRQEKELWTTEDADTRGGRRVWLCTRTHSRVVLSSRKAKDNSYRVSSPWEHEPKSKAAWMNS